MLLQRKYFSLKELVQYWQNKHDPNAEAQDFLSLAAKGTIKVYVSPELIIRSIRNMDEEAFGLLNLKGSVASEDDEGLISHPVVLTYPMWETGATDQKLLHHSWGKEQLSTGESTSSNVVSINLTKKEELRTLQEPLSFLRVGHISLAYALDRLSRGTPRFTLKDVLINGDNHNLVVTQNPHITHAARPKNYDTQYRLDCSLYDLYLLGEEIEPIESSMFLKEEDERSGPSDKTLYLVIALLKNELIAQKNNFNQSRLIEDLVGKQHKIKGISKTTLEKVFSAANKELDSR